MSFNIKTRNSIKYYSFFFYFSVMSPHSQHSVNDKYMKLNEYCDYLGVIILVTGFLGGASGKEPT